MQPLTDLHIGRRREFFAPFVSGKGLEIGPALMPTYPKSAGWSVETLDHLDLAGLRRVYAAEGAESHDIGRIEEVDFVVPDGRSYSAAVGDRRFDYVVACHVIEHSPDLVEFLLECAAILQPGGSLLLAVPTRELSFDFFRPLTTVGDVVAARGSSSAHALKARIDALMLDASINGERAWIPETLELHLRDGRVPDMNRAEEVNHGSLVKALGGDEHVFGLHAWFGHRWIFEPGHFVWLFDELRRLFRLPLTLVDVGPGVGSEFLVVMRLQSEEDPIAESSPEVPPAAHHALASRQPVPAFGDEAIYGTLPDDLRPANDAVLRQLEHHRKLLTETEQRLEALLRRRSVRVALWIAGFFGRLLNRRGPSPRNT